MAVIKPKVANMREMMMKYFWGKNMCLKSTLDREADAVLIARAMNEFRYFSCGKNMDGEWVYFLEDAGRKYLMS